MTEHCPCDTVRELKETVLRHDRQLSRDHTEFAEIQKDLQYIREMLDRKNRFNASAVSSLIQALCTLAVTLIAAKMGFS
ncbi:MAG: hypothetical protein IJO68_09010 [Clostridia bacterium]|nr:hypothetical protein [Clostridia bacterium]